MKVPKWTPAANVLFYRNFTIFFNNLVLQIFEGLVQPVLYLICFGYVLGSWFDITAVSSYAEFIFIGILCSIPMSISCYEACYSNVEFLSQKNFRKFLNILPIKYNDVYVSSYMWSVFKSIVIMGIFLIIGASLGLISIYKFLEIILLGIVVASFFACLTLLISTAFQWEKNDFSKILYLLIPLFLFTGTFFPVDIMPIVLREIALYNPLGFSIYTLRNTGMELWGVFEISMICTFLALSFLLLSIALHLQKENLYKIR